MELHEMIPYKMELREISHKGLKRSEEKRSEEKRSESERGRCI